MRRLTNGCGKAGRKQAGYTLVELLVVLVVIGIMLGLVTLSLAPDPKAKLNRDAQRLEALFALAAEEAQLSARPIAWRGDENGYAFFRQLPDGWAPIGDDPEFRARGWDLTPMRITLVADDVPRWSTRSGAGFNGAADGSTALAFPRDGSQAAFELHLEVDGKTVTLRGDGSGNYRVEQGA